MVTSNIKTEFLTFRTYIFINVYTVYIISSLCECLSIVWNVTVFCDVIRGVYDMGGGGEESMVKLLIANVIEYRVSRYFSSVKFFEYFR